VTIIAVLSALGGAGMLLFLWLARHGTVSYFGQPVGSDFTAFWNAGKLADAGEAASAWNPAMLNAGVEATHGIVFGTAWLYPPVFLLVAAPLAVLPYLPALLIWQLVSLGLLALTLDAILKDRRALLVALASPLTPMVLGHGQNAFLTASLLGSALLFLNRKPWRSGALFGGLIYKPQLGIVVVPLLLFTRSLRAILAAIFIAAALVALTICLWGIESWMAFFASLDVGRSYMELGAVGFYKSASLFSAVRMWGASIVVGYIVQAVGTIFAIYLLWTTRKASTNLRAAAACAAAALSTPYLLDYDMAVVGIGGAFLYAEAVRTRSLDFERTVLAFIWIAPWFSRPLAQEAAIPLGPVAMILLSVVAVRRARQGIAIPPLT
jgi:hypothetical protein